MDPATRCPVDRSLQFFADTFRFPGPGQKSCASAPRPLRSGHKAPLLSEVRHSKEQLSFRLGVPLARSVANSGRALAQPQLILRAQSASIVARELSRVGERSDYLVGCLLATVLGGRRRSY
jgi:hypothetical protein